MPTQETGKRPRKYNMTRAPLRFLKLVHESKTNDGGGYVELQGRVGGLAFGSKARPLIANSVFVVGSSVAGVAVRLSESGGQGRALCTSCDGSSFGAQGWSSTTGTPLLIVPISNRFQEAQVLVDCGCNQEGTNGPQLSPPASRCRRSWHF